MKRIDFVFFGTADIAVWVLDELSERGLSPALIVTEPDKPAGRKQELTPPPVKRWALEHEIDVLQPEKLNASKEMQLLLNSEWDLFVVAAYGQLIPRELLEHPKHKTLNMHPSLLPKFRGASPIRSAILEDERKTGVSIMLLDEKLDHGPIIAQASVELEERDWPPKGRVFDELMARAGGELLSETITPWIAGEITPEAQDHERATYSGKFDKAMGEIDLSGDPYQNYLKICAFDGWPGTFFFTEKDGARIRVKITDAEYENETLTILRVIPEGKKEMDYGQFLQN